MIEQINATTYQLLMPTGDVVEIGDILSADFKPITKLKRWGEECSIDLAIPTTEKISPIIQEEKIIWQGKDYGAEFFLATDGFKMNIILPKKPLTNVFPLDFGSDNLKFYFQPPLIQEFKAGYSEEFQTDILVTETDVKNLAGDVLVHRPKNVVGSYAVYHATKSNMHTSKKQAEKYRCGKAFHWYRPLIYDSSTPRKECWGILNVDPKVGIRTVTIPQSFLDSAIYPVTIDDTFGYDPLGSGATASAADTDVIIGTCFACPATGTATSLSWYNALGTYDDGPQMLGIYRASDRAFIIGTTEVSGQPTNQYNTIDLTAPTAITAQDYYLVHWGEEYSLKYDLLDNFPFVAYGFSYPGTWDDILNADTGTNRKFSIYCTYTPAEEAIVKIASEILGLSEGAVSRYRSFRFIPETIGIGEATLRLGHSNRVSSESLGLFDSAIQRKWAVRLLSEPLGIGEQLIKITGITKVFSEAVGVTDGFVKRFRATRLMTESLSIAESAVRRLWSVRLIAEAISIAEASIRRQWSIRISTETLSIIETAIKRSWAIRLIVETVGINDSLIRRLRSIKIEAETVNILDSGVSIIGLVLVMIMTEVVGIYEGFVQKFITILIKIMTETIGIHDAIKRFAKYLRAAIFRPRSRPIFYRKNIAFSERDNIASSERDNIQE